MSKRSRVIGTLSLMPILALAGCGEDHPQRDVYSGKDLKQAMDLCTEDWGSQDLCSEITDTEQVKSVREGQCKEDDEGQMQCVDGSAEAHYVYGPQYMSQHRTVTHNSFVYIPMSSRIGNYPVQPIGANTFYRGATVSAVSRSFSGFTSSRAVGSVSVSRGGFGATGAHVGSFGGA